MAGKRPNNEILLIDKVRDILEKIKEKGEATEELADLYVQLEETLAKLTQFRRARYGGKGA